MNRFPASLSCAAILLALAAGCGLGGTALAQSAATSSPVAGIAVTGTIKPETVPAATAPGRRVSAQEIERTKAISADEYLSRLPEARIVETPAGGFVGLHDLGPGQTLVLVNGRRFPSAAGGPGVDLGDIPVSMIDHIEVLPDGPSPTFGSDAIGGVVNIVTRSHFTGVEIGGSVGVAGRDGKLAYGVHSTMGADFSRGSLVINAETDHTDAAPLAAGP